jgi:hypothetical protein
MEVGMADAAEEDLDLNIKFAGFAALNCVEGEWRGGARGCESLAVVNPDA